MTDTGQLPNGGIAPTQPFEPRLKPAPVTLAIGAGISTLLLLMKVTVSGLLCVPAGTLPKLIFLGDNPATILVLVAEGLD